MSKLDELRALREAQFDRRVTTARNNRSRKPVTVTAPVTSVTPAVTSVTAPVTAFTALKEGEVCAHCGQVKRPPPKAAKARMREMRAKKRDDAPEKGGD